MGRTHRCVLLTGAVFLFALASFGFGQAGSRFQAKKPSTRLRSGDIAKLQRGMTPAQVRHLVGEPKHIARQILYHRYREQWVYEAPLSLRLTFDGPRGEKPQLLALPELPD